MFAEFFYLLRARGLDVSLSEWLTLLEALERGLHRSSLTGFYQLCRMVLVKDEADYDRFDRVFLEFFRDVPWDGELPPELLEWLAHPAEDLGRTIADLRRQGVPDETLEQLMARLKERLQEQTEEHNGGNYWVGTQGRSPFGNSGVHPGGIRIGGTGQHRTAVSVAGERRFRDFRGDATLDDSRFQTAFRLLRQMSFQSDGELEVDVDGTIHDTCDHGGTLSIRYRRPRKNAVKVLLMMDSGGSMEYYAGLCGALFRAATRSNHFKELHVYYFHNCVYDKLYLAPSMQWGGGGSVSLDWVLRNYDSSYKLILVGDAAMHPYELTEPMYDWATRSYGPSGISCLERLKKQYPHLVWLNPNPMPQRRDYWSQTHWDLGKVFPMYELTAEGLAAGMRRLMQKR